MESLFGTRSQYKYELHFALLSDEWSCQANNASLQSCFLALILHFRTKRSCENWKWQSSSVFYRMSGRGCHGPDQSSLTPGPIKGLSVWTNWTPPSLPMGEKGEINFLQSTSSYHDSCTNGKRWDLDGGGERLEIEIGRSDRIRDTQQQSIKLCHRDLFYSIPRKTHPLFYCFWQMEIQKLFFLV